MLPVEGNRHPLPHLPHHPPRDPLPPPPHFVQEGGEHVGSFQIQNKLLIPTQY